MNELTPHSGDDDGTASDDKRGRAALAIAAGVMAFLMATAWTQHSSQEKTAAGRRQELAELVAARQRRVAQLERQLDDARSRLNATARGSGRSRLISLEEQLDRMAALAGTRAVRGTGIVVELSDSDLGNKQDPESADFQIQDVDVQLIVNALWSAGAEALSVNGQRVVGTSAIRSAGGAVLVNYHVLTSPYRVVAIGDAGPLQRRFAESTIARRFRGWAEVYHLGFSIKRSGRLSVPAFGGAVRFRYAQHTKE
ncbi:MAG: DUF881 domain-containing protein [Actinomycetota bacterium]